MKCILHIGTEKTATTLLQEWLYLNRKSLGEQGVALSDALGKPNNRKLPVFFKRGPDDYLMDRGIHDDESKRTFFREFTRQFKEEVEAAALDHHSMIITSEHFHSRLTDADDILELKTFLADLFDSVTVICYFREQSDLALSSYSTALLSGYDGSLEKYLEHARSDSPYYDYLSMSRKWSDAFGTDNLIAAVYDRRCFMDGDIRVDFMARALPEVDASSLDYSLVSANERLSLTRAILLRALNRAYPRYREDGSLNRSRMPLAARILSEDELDVGAIHSAQRRRLYDTFSTGNLALSREFFDRDEAIFTPPGDGSANGIGSEEELEELMEALVAGFSSLLEEVGRASLSDEDADVLRDVALKYERGGSPSRDEAVRLMELAQSARPTGVFIRDKLCEWTRASAANDSSG